LVLYAVRRPHPTPTKSFIQIRKAAKMAPANKRGRSDITAKEKSDGMITKKDKGLSGSQAARPLEVGAVPAKRQPLRSGDADGATEEDQQHAKDGPHSDEDSASEDSSDDDSLALDGVIERNPDAPSSSSSDDDSEDDSQESDAAKPETEERKRQSQRAAVAVAGGAKKKKKRRKDDGLGLVQVEFAFCDMDEKYFDGIRALLHESSTMFQLHASSLTDVMIDNVSVGTIVSTADGGTDEGTVYAFASVVNLNTYKEDVSIQFLKEFILKRCPTHRREELQVVLSGETRRPAGLLLQARMINVPLEICSVLHEQLILDIDWAMKHAEGGPVEQKSLDFGIIVRLAPCTRGGSISSRKKQNANEKSAPASGDDYSLPSDVIYRYFEDEIFCSEADSENVFIVKAPPTFSQEIVPHIAVIVLTKAQHRAAVQQIQQLVARR
jgi:BCCIP